MKVCPVCQKTYTDDSLNYCLDDGSDLSFVSIRPANLVQSAEKRSSPMLPLLGVSAVIMILLIGGLAITAYMFVRSRNAVQMNVVQPEPKNPSTSTPLTLKSPTQITTPTSSPTEKNQSIDANTNKNSEKSSPTPLPAADLPSGLTYIGTATNTTIKKSAKITLTVNGSEDSLSATGRLSSGLFGRFENMPGRAVSCDKTAPEQSVCVQFSGQLLLGNDGSGFPSGTKAPFTVQIAFTNGATRASGTYQVGLIPKFESMGKQNGVVNLRR